MTSEQWTRICNVLDQALERPLDDRRDWLESVCADEPTVRAEVESLLDAYEPNDPVFEDREWGGTAWFSEAEDCSGARESTDSTAQFEPGTRIGAYRLLEEIGTGGMSVVYRAERADEAVEQTVAVKLLRHRPGTDDAEQRFQAEQQVLASLDHPNIAQFIDAGVTENGQYYLVLEYVEGTPITEYAEAHNLDVDERIVLMKQVLDAVQAAHRQLIVHRDLKPTNVLVTESERGSQVILLDFGIAKLIGDAVPVTQPQTQTGRLLMTPAYAAPEQVQGESIGVATDTYALGVLLYELLTDERPYGTAADSPYAVAQAVCETEPVPPSAAVDDPTRRSVLRGDLDAIVMKALRKAPDARFDSIEPFLADLNRYRADRPVRAKRGSAAYRAKKFLRRNRWAVGATALIFLLLAGYAVTVTVQARRIADQRDRAQTEAARAEEVSQFLVDLFEAADPEKAQGDTIPARTLLRRGADRVSSLDDQPQVQATLLHTLGRVHRRLGDLDRAAGLIHKSLRPYRDDSTSPPSSAYAEALGELGLLLRDQGNYEAPHPNTASVLRSVGDLRKQQGRTQAAAKRYRAAISMYEATVRPADSDLAVARSSYGVYLLTQGRPEDARPVLKAAYQALTSDSINPFLATQSARRYGRCLAMLGAYEEAEAVLESGRTLADSLGLSEPLKKIRTQLGSLYTGRGKQIRGGDESEGTSGE